MLSRITGRLGLCTTFVLTLAVLTVWGCSSPSQTSQPSASDKTRSPVLSILYTTPEKSLVVRDAASDTSRTLVRDASASGAHRLSPSGSHLAFRYSSTDSSHLAVFDLADRSLRVIDTRSVAATFSFAWHPDHDTLAYGYYGPAGSGTRGAGAVFTVSPSGEAKNVGCSAATDVLAWLPDGSLVARDDDHLYVVSPTDCATRTAVDAERLRAAAYAPTGTHLAYFRRKLTYEKDVHEYTPDTSLILSNERGQARESLFGADRRPRYLQWSPDGNELAFTVHVDATDRRQISIYNVNTERTVYLTPPSKTAADQIHPRWSPSASHVAFTRENGSQSVAAVRMDGHTRRLAPVEGAVWGWVDDRTLVVPGPDSLRITSLDGRTQHTQPTPSTVVHVWRMPPA